VAIDLIGTVLRRKRPLDDAIEDNVDMGQPGAARSRFFAATARRHRCCAVSARSMR